MSNPASNINVVNAKDFDDIKNIAGVQLFTAINKQIEVGGDHVLETMLVAAAKARKNHNPNYVEPNKKAISDALVAIKDLVSQQPDEEIDVAMEIDQLLGQSKPAAAPSAPAKQAATGYVDPIETARDLNRVMVSQENESVGSPAQRTKTGGGQAGGTGGQVMGAKGAGNIPSFNPVRGAANSPSPSTRGSRGRGGKTARR